MQKISTCLWFDSQAEEAARFYVSVFKNSRVVGLTHFTEGLPRPAGTVMTVQFILDGEEFVALNGGSQYTFSPAISLVANCDTQEEVDHLWQKLCEGGEEVQCGWLRDKYGISWQVVPVALMEMLSTSDEAASQRAVAAMLAMKKLDIAALRRAYENT
jgi:predicted 3-demethylubiquinone-9 3-methyltransferase (glyoxalase superfamily)